MDLYEKKELLESFLKKPYDVSNEANDLADDVENSTMLIMKHNLIIFMLKKLGYNFALLDKEENNYFEGDVDYIYSTLFLNLKSWKLIQLNSMDYSYMVNETKEDVEKSLKSNLPHFFDLKIPENKDILDFLIDISFHTDSGFILNIFHNPYLNDMIEKRMVDVNCLEGLKYPMLIFPYGIRSSYDSSQKVISWLTGWDEGSSFSFTLAFLQWRFIFSILYVDTCYQIHYVDDKQTFKDYNRFIYV